MMIITTTAMPPSRNMPPLRYWLMFSSSEGAPVVTMVALSKVYFEAVFTTKSADALC